MAKVDKWQQDLSLLRQEVRATRELSSIKFMYILHKLTNSIIQVPHWDDANEQAASHGSWIPEEEAERYKELAKGQSGWTLAMVLLHSIYVIKNYIFLPLWLNAIDNHSWHNRLQTLHCNKDSPKSSNYILYQVDCLRTNCTRLSTGADATDAFESDLKALPIYSLCHSYLKQLYCPYINFHPLGFIMYCWLSCWVFMSLILYPIYGYLSPVRSQTMMDIFCPMSGMERARKRQVEQLVEYKFSLENFKQASCHRELMRGTEDERAVGHNWSKPSKRVLYTCFLHAAHHEHCHKLRPTTPRQAFNQALERLRRAGACLPIEFTDWWRSKVARHFILDFAGYFIGGHIVPTFLFAIDYFDIFSWKSHPKQLVQQDHCSFWIVDEESSLFSSPSSWSLPAPSPCRPSTNASLSATKVVDLNEARHEWNPITLAENFSILFLTIIICGTLIVDLIYGVTLLRVKMMELREQLTLAIEMGFLIQRKPKACEQSMHQTSEVNFSQFRYIRQLYTRTIGFQFMFARKRRHKRIRSGSSTNLEECLAYQEIALKILDKTNYSYESYLDLLDNIQLNAWSVLESLNQLHEPSTRALSLTYVLIYCMSLITAYTQRKFNSELFGSLMVTFSAMMATNFVILVCSNVNSCSLTLRPKYWSLMAVLAKSKDVRIEHAKSLLLKQLVEMDYSNGLALKMFGRVNVTYTGIIELTIWTSSILLLAYSRY